MIILDNIIFNTKFNNLCNVQIKALGAAGAGGDKTDTYIIYFKNGECIQIKADDFQVEGNYNRVSFRYHDNNIAFFNWNEIIGFVNADALHNDYLPIELIEQYKRKEQN